MKAFFTVLILAAIIVLVVMMGRNNQTENNQVSQETESMEQMESMEENVMEQGESMEMVSGMTYVVNTDQSEIAWVGKAAIVPKKHAGTSPITEGSVTFNEDMTEVSGMIVFDLANSTADGSGVMNHLKGEDFFEVATYPTAQIKLTGISEVEGQKMLTGDFTIKDTTKPITFPVDLVMGEGTVEASGTFEFDRTQWGIRFGSSNFFDNLGEQAIADMVEVSFKVMATRQ